MVDSKLSRASFKSLVLTAAVGASLAMLPMTPASAFTGAAATGVKAGTADLQTTDVQFRGRGHGRRGFRGSRFGGGYGRGEYGYRRGYGGGRGAAIGAGLAGAAIGAGIGAAVAGSR